jgi:hypothetical protein
MKKDGRRQLRLNLDKKWKVKNGKSHVTACFSAMIKGYFCLRLDSFSVIYMKVTSYSFKCKDEHTPFVINVMKYHV